MTFATGLVSGMSTSLVVWTPLSVRKAVGDTLWRLAGATSRDGHSIHKAVLQ